MSCNGTLTGWARGLAFGRMQEERSCEGSVKGLVVEWWGGGCVCTA